MSEHDPKDDYDDEPWRRRWWVEKYVLVPGSSIVALAVIQCVLAAFAIAIPDVYYVTESAPHLTIPLAAVALIWNLVIVSGAWGMHRFRRYQLSVVAAVMSLVPIPCIYCAPFSVPLGIWTLVVLFRPDVRARFAAVARGTIKESRPNPE